MVSRSIPIRLEDPLIERFDKLAAALTERAAGATVTRSAAMRVAMERGLEELEAELGLKATRRPKPRR